MVRVAWMSGAVSRVPIWAARVAKGFPSRFRVTPNSWTDCCIRSPASRAWGLGLRVDERQGGGAPLVARLGHEPLRLGQVALERRQARVVRRGEPLGERAVRHLGVALVDLDHPLVV